MISVLRPPDGVTGPELSPCRGLCIAFLDRALSPLSRINLMLEVTLQWTSIQPGQSRTTPSRFMPLKLEMHAGLMGHVVHMRTSPPHIYAPTKG